MVRHVRALLLGVLCTLTLVLSACASIPTKSDVGRIEVTDENAAVQSRIDPDGPVPGSSPDEIVRGFLQAGAGYSNNYEVARSYLTDGFADSWKPSASVSVLAPGTSFDNVTTEVTTDSQSVSLTVPLQGLVDKAHVYRSASSRTSRDIEFTLRQVNGEWRISAGPDGTILTEANFTAVYQAYPLYFYSPDHSYLVPDTRWFIRSPATASDVTTALLAGPADYLVGSVVSAVPEGTELDPKSVTVDDGVAEVGLNATVDSLDAQSRSSLVAQLNTTLTAISSVNSVQVSTGSGELSPDVTDPPQTSVSFTPTPVAISGNHLVTLDGNTVEDVPGGPELAKNPSFPAAALDDSMYAYVTDKGKAIHRVMIEDMDDAEVLTGSRLTAPSFDRYTWMWTAEAKGKGTVRALSGAGVDVAFTLEDYGDRTITRVRVSRDGTRLGVLSRDGDGEAHLEVFGLVRNGEGEPEGVTSAAPLAVAANFGEITDFSWAGSGDLVILAHETDASSAQPYAVPVSGLPQALGTIDSGSRITAAGDTRTIRVGTSTGDVFTYGAGSWQRLVDAGVYDPAYPG